MPHPGLLIAFEGIDGGGKTTQARRVADALRARGHEVILTKEPTNGPHGARIRASAVTGRLPAEEELALFLADRQQHVTELILPALERGAVVIVDRYYPSTVAYQGIRGWDPADLRARNEVFAPAPDLLFVLDIPARQGLARVQGRGDVADAFEKEDLLEASRGIFRTMASWPGAAVIDATQPLAEVSAIVDAHVDQALRGARGRADRGGGSDR